MKNRNELRRRFRVWLIMVGAGMLVGPPVNYLFFGQTTGALLRGLMDGPIIAALVAGYGQFVSDFWLRSFFRRTNFSTSVLINAFVYLVLFHIGRILTVSLRSPEEVADFTAFLLAPQMLAIIPVFYLIAVAAEFLLQMNRLVGHNVLRYYLAGTYHRPIEEERIFMFLDLQDSTAMAEQMGGKAYYALLEQFVNALTEPVLATRGEIHEYVGDEVVITWKRELGLRDANCLRCFFLIEDALNEMADKFEQRFSRQPQFRAGMHGGQVIAGELGDIKRDIVFVGDVVNTAARLEEFAKKENRRFVVSDAIVDAVELPDEITADFITEHQPRGKAATVRLYEVQRTA